MPQRKYREATTDGTDGVVVQTRAKYLNNHPVRSLSMLRGFFDVAATPPVQEGQCPVPHFIHSFIDRAYSRNRILPLIVAVLLMLLMAHSAIAADLRIAAASDLNFAIKEIIAQYERDTGNRALLTLGSSGTFFTQISEGAPFDIYLSADRSYSTQLLDKKLAEPGSLFIYGIGKMVVWVPKNSEVDVSKLGMQALLQNSIRKISIANPDHAPYGRAAVAAMQRAGLYDRVKDKLVLGENISQAAEFVQSGAAQAGILALSLAISAPMRDTGKYWEIPLNTYPVMEQSAVILRRARDTGNLEAAQSFMRTLKAPPARAILDRYGFMAAQP